jgi:hypothetical protein
MTEPHIAPAEPPIDLQRFADTGLLRTVRGLTCVAGASTDPSGVRVDCLVEYAPVAVLTDPVALAELARQVTPGIEAGARGDLVVRGWYGIELPAPLRRDLTYLTLNGPAPLPASPRIPIEPSRGPDTDALVADWLTTAFVRGGRAQGRPADSAAVRTIVRGILDAPDRISLLARPGGGAPVAHATLLTDSYDDLLGADFVELVDILVADGHDQRTLTAELVGAADRHARSLGRPLVGNVIHDHRPEERERTGAVVARLLGQGWQIRDEYWRCPFDDLSTARGDSARRVEAPR